MIIQFAVTVVLLMISAMVSASEVAFFSMSNNDIREIKEQRTFAGETVLKLLSDVDMLLATILIVNNLVNICIVILTADIISETLTFYRFEFLFKSVFVTFILLLFGEILPKIFAQGSYKKVALFLAQPLSIFKKIFYPFAYVLVRTSSRISEMAARNEENISIEELADAVDMTETSSDEEQKMLSGIVSFVNTEVEEIMHARVDITAIPLTATIDEGKRTIKDSGYSRIPD